MFSIVPTNEIALLKRSDKLYQLDIRDDGNRTVLRIGSGTSTGDDVIFIGKESYDKPKKYDKRTYKDLVFAFGFNNALIEGQSLDNSPYKIGGSGFIELGYDWKRRIFKDSNFYILTGITPALSKECQKNILNSIKIAKLNNVKIVFDLNYRRNLWTGKESLKFITKIIN